MKSIVLSMFLLCQALFLPAQEEQGKISDADGEQLIPHLQNEECFEHCFIWDIEE